MELSSNMKAVSVRTRRVSNDKSKQFHLRHESGESEYPVRLKKDLGSGISLDVLDVLDV